MRIPLIYVTSMVWLLSGASSLAQPSPAVIDAADATTAKTAAKAAVFSQEQLHQMLAPIALYPDPLLAQVLMATTYPGEVAEAVTWSSAHLDAKGDDAVKQVADQSWDPSVQALVAFPQVVAMLGQDPVWVQRLGDAFLAQPDDVMQSVQHLRGQAQQAGNLQSNQYQNVTVQAAAPAPASNPAATQKSSTPAANTATTTIIIEPADPQVVYVPTYNPTTTYGTWAYPASPPVYYPPSPAYYAGSALLAGLAFGTGVAIVNSLWGDCDWGNNDVDIDVNRYNNINNNNRISNNQNTWQHNAAHRDGVPYRDSRSREQYGRQLDGASRRTAYRGDDAQRAQARENASRSMERHGLERPAASNREARDRTRAARSEVSRTERAQTQPTRSTAADRRHDSARDTGQNQAARATPRADQRDVKARQPAQKRPAASAGRARDNAFDGVRSPSRANAQANRGRSSQAFAQRPQAARSSGHQINRSSSSATRSRGGRR